MEHEGKTAGYWSLPKDTQKKLQTTFRPLKIIIVDEVSMVSNLNLTYLHLRLDDIMVQTIGLVPKTLYLWVTCYSYPL